MIQSSEHYWRYDYFDPKSLWLFVHPSEYAESLGIYVLELGHFYQGGRCYTRKAPENSFSINFFSQHADHPIMPTEIIFPNETYYAPSVPDAHGFSLIDNHAGYTMERTGKVESYFIQFGGFLAEQYCQMIMNQRHYAEFDTLREEYLVDTFEKLVQIYRQPATEKNDICAALLLTQIFSSLILKADMKQYQTAGNDYVKRMLEIVETRFSEPLSLKGIADELHINSSYLSRLIINDLGISFSFWLTQVRLNNAKRLLQTTACSVEEIAEMCGFCNASHFVRQFHQKEKITPLQYRKIQSR